MNRATAVGVTIPAAVGMTGAVSSRQDWQAGQRRAAPGPPGSARRGRYLRR
ncbi:MAG: hypothetical protein WAK71_18990 [Streptosporangiaceae bacterium]